jgi:glycosyltransferase involved in cell wall biosynthesis
MDKQGPHYMRVARSGGGGERPLLSIVVPVYNEGAVVEEFYARTARVLDGLEVRWEIVAVNDGSGDDTLERLVALHRRDERVKVLDLSRNFGKEIALTAGLDHAGGDAVVPMDADLQDPPEVIPELVRRWRQGYDVVYATRQERLGESWLRRWTAGLFYRVLRRMARVDVPGDTGDFRLLARPVVDALRGCREHRRFMKGLFSWVGFRQVSVKYRRDARLAGRTKWNYRKLWNLAVEGITSFSAVPLQVASYLGMITTACGLVAGGLLVGERFLGGRSADGDAALLAVVVFLGGVQLLSIGVLGEYVGRIYDETKQRPLYFVRQRLGVSADGAAQPERARGNKRAKVAV